MSDATQDSPEMELKNRAALTAWVEANLGGRVVAIAPIYRERQTWVIDYEVGGEIRKVLAKGRRRWDAVPYPLEMEMRANQVLARNGITVPTVFGMLDDPHVFFMDWVDSDDRETGLLSQTEDGDRGGLPADRWAASLKYIDELAQMHAIPVEEFAEAGVAFPSNPTELGTGLGKAFYDMLARRMDVPARLEFFYLWLVRNAPQHRAAGSFVAGDACQFLSSGSEVVALLDFELGYIGDPLQDLACFRCRHPVENLGDIYALFRRYAEATNTPLDLPVLAYQTVHFLAVAITGVSIAVMQHREFSNPTETMSQLCFSSRRGYEAMAEIVGVELEDVVPPKPFRSPYAEHAIAGLAAEIAQLPTSETF